MKPKEQKDGPESHAPPQRGPKRIRGKDWVFTIHDRESAAIFFAVGRLQEEVGGASGNPSFTSPLVWSRPQRGVDGVKRQKLFKCQGHPYGA